MSERLAIYVLASIGLFASQRETVPHPDTARMEAAVAEKIEGLRREVIERPDSGERWGRLGMTFHAHGLEVEAAACYRRAAELEGKDFRWPYLSAQLAKKEDLRQALDLAHRAADLNPEYPPGQVLVAQLLEQAGEPESALRRYDKAVAADPRCAMAELGLARLKFAKGNWTESRGHLERAAALQGQAAAVQAFGARLYRVLGDESAARTAAERARRGSASLSIRDPVLGQMLDEAVSALGYQNRAARAEAAGDLETATRLLERYLEIRPNDANAHYNVGNFFVRQQGYRQAIAHYEKALEIRPEHVAASVNLGNALVMIGELDRAVSRLQAALEKAPDDVDAHRSLGQTLAYQGRTGEAIIHYRAVLARTPDAGPVHGELAIALARQGDYRAAWEHVEKAQSLGAELPPDFVRMLLSALPPPR